MSGAQLGDRTLYIYIQSGMSRTASRPPPRLPSMLPWQWLASVVTQAASVTPFFSFFLFFVFALDVYAV